MKQTISETEKAKWKVEPYTVSLNGHVIDRGFTAEHWDRGFIGHFPTRAQAQAALAKGAVEETEDFIPAH